MITFLERHAGITDVQYFERPPCATRDIENWERAHYPCVLPEDFKSFLRLSDGLLLKWAIKQGDLTQPLGCMQVNDVANLSPCPRGTFAPGEGVFDTGETPPECVAAFELDSNALDGRLALLYRAGALQATDLVSGPQCDVVLHRTHLHGLFPSHDDAPR